MNTDQTPIFVYGTLRPGWGNSRLWQGRADDVLDGVVTVTGFRLVSGGSFPFAIPAADSHAVGALIYPHDADYDAVLADMDRLEGYPTFYDRIMVVATTPDGHVKAWIYTPAGNALRYGDMPAVDGDDWSAAHPERVAAR